MPARSATRWPRTDDTAVPHRGDARDPGTQEASTAVRTISPTLSMEPVGPAGQRPLSAGTAASESSPYVFFISVLSRCTRATRARLRSSSQSLGWAWLAASV